MTRPLRRALRHYEIAATLGPYLRVMRSCRPVLDKGVGVNILLTSKNWRLQSEGLQSVPEM